ncbi:MAG: hypothetical protein JWQ71_3457 [Pedosphaera sp.]|nr:hypothetical protein [Pedosphaera sp.]
MFGLHIICAPQAIEYPPETPYTSGAASRGYKKVAAKAATLAEHGFPPRPAAM